MLQTRFAVHRRQARGALYLLGVSYALSPLPLCAEPVTQGAGDGSSLERYVEPNRAGQDALAPFQETAATGLLRLQQCYEELDYRCVEQTAQALLSYPLKKQMRLQVLRFQALAAFAYRDEGRLERTLQALLSLKADYRLRAQDPASLRERLNRLRPEPRSGWLALAGSVAQPSGADQRYWSPLGGMRLGAGLPLTTQLTFELSIAYALAEGESPIFDQLTVWNGSIAASLQLPKLLSTSPELGGELSLTRADAQAIVETAPSWGGGARLFARLLSPPLWSLSIGLGGGIQWLLLREGDRYGISLLPSLSLSLRWSFPSPAL